MDNFLNTVVTLLSTYGIRIIIAVLLLIIGRAIVKAVAKAVGKAIDRSGLDETVKNFAKNAVRVLLYIILIIAIIQVIGIPMTSVIAILASCGLAVGLALQGALSNLAGGLMILIFKPFKIGDFIESAGAVGTVKDISIFYTSILTIDNKKVFVPNGDLMNATVSNYSAEELRRVDIDFKVSNATDQELAKSILLKAAGEVSDVLDDPAPFARLTGVAEDTFIFTVRAWCESAKYWDAYFDLIENCCKALSENGIGDPEDKVSVRVVKEA